MNKPDLNSDNIKEVLRIVEAIEKHNDIKHQLDKDFLEMFEVAQFDIEKLKDFLIVAKDEGLCEECGDNTGGFSPDLDNAKLDKNYCAECAIERRG